MYVPSGYVQLDTAFERLGFAVWNQGRYQVIRRMFEVIVERRLSFVSVAITWMIFAYFFEALPNFTHVVMKSFGRWYVEFWFS